MSSDAASGKRPREQGEQQNEERAEVAAQHAPLLDAQPQQEQEKEEEEEDRKPSAKKIKKPAPFKLTKLTSEFSDIRRTNDEIHSSIELATVLKTIVDTPQFQRLRGLKQLGTAEFVYCNATQNRLEHSLGVAHLARFLCERIRSRQPGLRCTAKDVLCIQLAGLLHDMGHGPFSHVFEGFVKDQQKEQRKRQQQSNDEASASGTRWPDIPNDWHHEQASHMMLNAALEHLGLAVDLHNLDAPLKQIGDGIDATTMRVFSDDDDEEEQCRRQEEEEEEDGDDDKDRGSRSTTTSLSILTSRDWVFIQECITGAPLPSVEAIHGPGLHGRRAEHQEWLYDIVHNRHSGLDVDKVDYYARDQRRALRESGEIDKVVIENAVVAWAACTREGGSCARCRGRGGSSGEKQHPHDGMHLMICFPKKMIPSCAEFFKTRFRLHSTIYQHKTTVAVGLMIQDILRKADPFLSVPTGSLSGKPAAATATSGFHGYDSLPISRTMCHAGAYLRMQDWIIGQIEITTCPALTEARKLIYRLHCRDLYKCVATMTLDCRKKETHRMIWDKPDSDIVQEIMSVRGKHGDDDDDDDVHGRNIKLCEDDVIVQKISMHHGLKDKNPLSKMRFVEKTKLDKLTARDYTELPEAETVDEGECDPYLPRTLEARSLRIYCRDSSKAKCDLLQHIFSLFWKELESEMELTANGLPERHRVAMLTQDSDDEGWDNRSPLPDQMEEDGTPKSITPVRYKQYSANFLP